MTAANTTIADELALCIGGMLNVGMSPNEIADSLVMTGWQNPTLPYLADLALTRRRCLFDAHADAVAIWHHEPSGKRSPLCQGHLDIWFDNADDSGREPVQVTMLVPAPTLRGVS